MTLFISTDVIDQYLAMKTKIQLHKYSSSQLRANSHRNQIQKFGILKQIWLMVFSKKMFSFSYNNVQLIYKYLYMTFHFVNVDDISLNIIITYEMKFESNFQDILVLRQFSYHGGICFNNIAELMENHSYREAKRRALLLTLLVYFLKKPILIQINAHKYLQTLILLH